MPFVESEQVSFDGSFSTRNATYFPDRYKNLEAIFKVQGPFSTKGAGLSYPALSFGEKVSVIDLEHFNRILQFDPEKKEIEVEAGISLGALTVFCLKQGLYLKIMPGHPSIKVGGCLGSDVHGKNQFLDGTFKDQVIFFRLFHPAQGHVFCSRTENPELFHLTIGGWGLTGLVLSMGLKLAEIPAKVLVSTTQKIGNFSELLPQMQGISKSADLLYSWHNLLNSSQWGRGFLKSAVFEDSPHRPKTDELLTWTPLMAHRNAFKFNLMNHASVSLMNLFYQWSETKGSTKKIESLVSFLFPVAKKTFYFSLFGPAGFYESQVLIPFENFIPLVNQLKKGIEKFPIPVTLASCKLFSGTQDYLRFSGTGIVLALNFPRSPRVSEFLTWWDSAILEHGALPNLTKDSRVPLEMVKNCFPEYEKFKSQLAKWDPQRLFQNALSQRLQL